MELKPIHTSDFVDIAFDKKNQWLYVNWKGYQSDALIIEGCERMLAALVQYRATRILNDNRELLGIWTGVAKWIGSDWFPRIRAAGLEKFAIIYSARLLPRLSADTAMLLADPGKEIMAAFHAQADALEWLAPQVAAIEAH